MIPVEIERRSAAGYPNGVYHFKCSLCDVSDENLSSGHIASEAMVHTEAYHNVSRRHMTLLITDEDEKKEGGAWALYHYEVGATLLAIHGSLLDAVRDQDLGDLICWLKFGEHLSDAIDRWAEENLAWTNARK